MTIFVLENGMLSNGHIGNFSRKIMTNKLLAFTILLAGMHQTTSAETRMLDMYSAGVTTNSVSFIKAPIGSAYMLASHSWYDSSEVASINLANGSQVETVEALTYLQGQNAAGYPMGHYEAVSKLVVTYNPFLPSASERSIDLSIFTYGGYAVNDNLPWIEVTYHITTEDLDFGSLLSSSPGLGIFFGPSTQATAEFVYYDDNYFPSRVRGILELDVTRGYVVSSIPEPATYAMFGLGLGVIGLLGRRRPRKG